MDSSGLALLVQVARRVGSVEIRHPTPIVRRVIEVAGLQRVLGLAP
jgi:anti-anti-sigma factor